jgi:hypothetical protein
LIGTATGWGGNASKDATYFTVVPPKNDGKILNGMWTFPSLSEAPSAVSEV